MNSLPFMVLIAFLPSNGTMYLTPPFYGHYSLICIILTFGFMLIYSIEQLTTQCLHYHRCFLSFSLLIQVLML